MTTSTLSTISVVKNIKTAIDEYVTNSIPEKEVNIIYSKPWHPFPKYEEEKDTLFHEGMTEKSTGIYIFSEADKDNALLPIDQNNNKIWYIGMSNNNTIRGRVWNHLEPMNFNATIENQQWAASEWVNRKNVDKKIQDSILTGNFVVYGIQIDSFSKIDGKTRGLEKFLIRSYQNTTGEKPLFNLMS